MQEVTNFISSLGPETIYILLFLNSFLENVVPPVPGDLVTIFGAYLVGIGVLKLTPMIGAALLGSIIGFMFVYYVGLYLGNAFFSDERRKRLFSPKNTAKAQRWLSRYGYKVILINRFLPGVRSIISPLAGASKMSAGKIALYGSVGMIIWNGLLVFAGLIAGENWEMAAQLFRRYNTAAFIIMALLVCVGSVLYWRKRKVQV